MTRRIIVTGANGFVGGCLLRYFHERRWAVRALVHRVPEITLRGVEYVPYEMETRPEDAIFLSADFLVHCAYLRYERNKDAHEINTKGTENLIAACRKYGVKMVFVSSFSAHSEARSQYGRTKLHGETLFDLSKDVVLKAGLVIGDEKGLPAEMAKRIQHSRLFPLLGGGKQPVQSVCIQDFCRVVEKVLVDDHVGLFHVAEPRAVSLKAFYCEIANQLNRKIVFVPVPMFLLYGLCRLSETLGLKLPVSSESVLGLKYLREFETREDLRRLGVEVRNFRKSLEAFKVRR